ncbi:TetR/AcrR family transcriptional regulator C-terminal domain-containing protein [Kribbella sp. NPDC056861]|uniref:TetR/AcrR family transcriptional regulator C-terminal domain-containing protein n=1 Tax=Kribbella sp. NPDC056861 TaxID=3154857 RepID=UPI00343E6BBC
MDRNDPAPSVWLVERTGRKIAKGSVDLNAIAVAAAVVLDEVGLDGLTMRALGQQLGVSAMACYAHVRHKDDVLELAQDHLMGQLKVTEDQWDGVLRALAEDYRTLLITHPWLPSLAGRFLNAGPNAHQLSVRASAALVAGGLAEKDAPLALSAVFTLAHGHGAIEAAWRGRLGDRASLDQLTNRLAALAPADPVTAQRAAVGTAESTGREWTFALDCLLEGVRRRKEDDD